MTYTVSSAKPPGGELYFLKVNRKTPLSRLYPDTDVGIPETSVLATRQINVLAGTESRPVGSAIDFNDRYKELMSGDGSLNEEFTFSKFNSSSTTNPELFEAYGLYQTRLFEVSQRILALNVEISNNETLINLNVAKLQAVDDAIGILPNNVNLTNEKQFLIDAISELELLVSAGKTELKESEKLKSEYTDSIRKLSKVI